MNYQVATFISQYINKKSQSKIKFIYSEKDSIWLINLDKYGYKSIEPKIELHPLEILNLQGVTYETVERDNSSVTLYKKVVSSLLPLKLGGVLFDDIISENNFLRFIKFINDKVLDAVNEFFNTKCLSLFQ